MIKINKDVINKITNDADLGMYVRSLVSNKTQLSHENVMELVTACIRSSLPYDVTIEVVATALMLVSEGSSIEDALLESLKEWDIA